MEPLSAPVFDVQRFSIHDGPGIRTTVFFKGCNLHCDWCQNPESQSTSPIVSFMETRCDECFSCADVCSNDAIIKAGFRLDYQRCALCLQCIDACPNGALRLIGEELSPEQLFERLVVDQAYYESSGGGVTFSGGEPTLYPNFMNRMLDLCKEHGIHTTLETCGTFSQKRWATILPKLNLIYFDLKVMDNNRHKQMTGVGNHRILENAKYLVAMDYPVEFRLTLVPEHTDDLENLKAIIGFLKEVGHRKIHVQGYHRMGEVKIGSIDGDQKKLGLKSYSADMLQGVSTWFEQQGIIALGS